MQQLKSSEILNESALRSLVANSINKCRTLEGADKVDIRYTINYVDNYNGNVDQVSIILDNVIANGINYQCQSIKNSYIDIFISSTKQKLKIKVLDNGVGMDSEESEKVLLRLNGAKNSEQNKLGLYIVNEILQKSNGSFMIESVKNSGTMIMIELPNVININNKNPYEFNNNN